MRPTLPRGEAAGDLLVPRPRGGVGGGELKDGGIVRSISSRPLPQDMWKLSPRILGSLASALSNVPLCVTVRPNRLTMARLEVACNDEVRSGRIWQRDPFECRREELVEELTRFREECMGKASACAHQVGPVADVLGF